MINWIIAIIAVGIVVGTIAHFIKSSKSEKSSCGCGGACSSCGSDCAKAHSDVKKNV